jgi:hypothetical protein
VEAGGERAGGSGQVERHRGEDQPGAVGGEPPGGQVREWAVLQVGDDLFDGRVAAVVGLGLDQRERRVGEHGAVAPGREQLSLLVGDDVVGVAAGARP